MNAVGGMLANVMFNSTLGHNLSGARFANGSLSKNIGGVEGIQNKCGILFNVALRRGVGRLAVA
jgi:hypothetical protein